MEDWDIQQKQGLLSASPRRLLGASSEPKLTFAANGYSYKVTIDPDAGGVVAEQGDPLPLKSLKIDDFAVWDGYLAIRFTARPATWLYGFSDLIRVRASESLPIPGTADSVLDMSGAELRLEDGDTATIFVPLGDDSPNRFFRVESREN